MKPWRPRLWHQAPLQDFWAALRGKKLIVKQKKDPTNLNEKVKFVEIPSVHKDEHNDRIERSLDTSIVGGNHLVSMTMGALALIGLAMGMSELAFTTLAIYSAISNLTQTLFRFIGGHYERNKARNKNLNKLSKTARQTLLFPAYIVATLVALAPSLVANVVFAATLPFLAFVASVLNVGFGLSHTIFQARMWYKTPSHKPYALERRRTQMIKRAAQTVGAILTSVVLGVLCFGIYTVASPAYFPLAITAGVVNTIVFAYSGFREVFPTFYRGRKTFAPELLEAPEVPENIISKHQQNLRNESLKDKIARYEKEYLFENRAAKGEEGYHHHLDLAAEIQGIENNEALNEWGEKPTPEEKIKAIHDFVELLIRNKKQAIQNGLDKREQINKTGSLWERMSKLVKHTLGITSSRKQQEDKMYLLDQMPHLIDNTKPASTNPKNPFKDLHHYTAPEILLVTDDESFRLRCRKGELNPRTLYVFQNAKQSGELSYVCLNEAKTPLVMGSSLKNLSADMTKEIDRCFKENIAEDGMARLSEQKQIDEILNIAQKNKQIQKDNLETCFYEAPELEEGVFKAYYNKFSEMEILIRAFREAARPAIERLNNLIPKNATVSNPFPLSVIVESKIPEGITYDDSTIPTVNTLSRDSSDTSIDSKKTEIAVNQFSDSHSGSQQPQDEVDSLLTLNTEEKKPLVSSTSPPSATKNIRQVMDSPNRITHSFSSTQVKAAASLAHRKSSSKNTRRHDSCRFTREMENNNTNAKDSIPTVNTTLAFN